MSCFEGSHTGMPSMQYVTYREQKKLAVGLPKKENAAVKSKFHLDAASGKHITRSAHTRASSSLLLFPPISVRFSYGTFCLSTFVPLKEDLTFFWLNPRLCTSLVWYKSLSPLIPMLLAHVFGYML